MSFSVPERLRSRKFWVALGSLIAVALGVPEGNVVPFVLVVASYLLGQSFVDGVGKK